MIRHSSTPLVLAVVLCAIPSWVSAKPTRVALAKLEGDKGNEVGQAVTDALDGSDITLVPPKEVTRTIEKLGLSEELTDEKELKKLQSELEAAALVQGKLDKEGGNRTLHFKVFVNGKKTKGFSVQFSNAKSDKFKKMVKQTMVAKIGAVTGDAPEEAADDGKDKKGKKGAKDKKVAEADDDTDKKAKGKKGKKGEEVADDDTDKKAKGKKGAKDKKVAEADDDTDKKAKGKKGKKGEEVADDDTDKKAKGKKGKKGEEVADDDTDKKAKGKKGKKGEEVADDDTKGKKKKSEEVAAAAAAEDKKPDEANADDDGKKKVAKKEPDGDEPKKATKKVARADGDSLDDSTEISVRVAAPSHTANRLAVRLDAGVSFSNRSLKYNTKAFDNAPQPYSNVFVPGIRFDAEMYPFAFSNPKSAVAGIGFEAEIDQTVGLKLRSSVQPETPLPTTQRHYSVGARYRIAFGSSPTSPTVTLGIGYGRRTFKADRTPLMEGNVLDLPDTDYKYFDPGLDIRIPLVPSVAFFVGGRGMLITSAGPIVTADNYGQAKITGILASGGFDVVLSNRFAIRFVGEYAQMGFKFNGNGNDLATNRDGDPTTQEVFGATDRSYGGAATLAVLY